MMEELLIKLQAIEDNENSMMVRHLKLMIAVDNLRFSTPLKAGTNMLVEINESTTKGAVTLNRNT